MISYKLLQHFDQHGRNNGYSVQVSVASDDFDSDDTDLSLERYESDLDALEGLRRGLLCMNSNTSETYVKLLENLQDARDSFNQVASALRTAREQYETMQAFLQAQGIKSMDNFPNLAVPKLTGELLEDPKDSKEF